MEDWPRLAVAVESRRGHLGYSSRADLAEATGFPERTLSDLERHRRNSFSDATLAKLERALRWPQGTARVILDGGPVPDQFAPALAYSIDTATGMKITPSGKEFPPVVDDILHLLTDDFSPLDADEKRHFEESLRHQVLALMSMARRVRAALEAESPSVFVARSDSGKSDILAHVTEVPDQHPDPAPVSVRRRS